MCPRSPRPTVAEVWSHFSHQVGSGPGLLARLPRGPHPDLPPQERGKEESCSPRARETEAGGDRLAVAQDPLEHAGQRSPNIVISDSQDSYPQCPELGFATGVLFAALRMHRPIDLKGEPEPRAVEVDDVPGDHVLSTELPTGEASCTQGGPKQFLAPCRLRAHGPCRAELGLRSTRPQTC